MTSITSSGRRPPTGLHSAADLVSATRKSIMVAAVALVVAIAAIAAAAAPLLSAQLRGADDPATPAARDLAKRLDQLSAELDRLRQGMQQRESAQADLLDQQKRLSDGLAVLTQETAEIRAQLARDLTTLRGQVDAMHPQTEEAERPAAEERRSRRGRRGRRSMSFTVPNR